jgi:hypothetical protein
MHVAVEVDNDAPITCPETYHIRMTLGHGIVQLKCRNDVEYPLKTGRSWTVETFCKHHHLPNPSFFADHRRSNASPCRPMPIRETTESDMLHHAAHLIPDALGNWPLAP